MTKATNVAFPISGAEKPLATPTDEWRGIPEGWKPFFIPVFNIDEHFVTINEVVKVVQDRVTELIVLMEQSHKDKKDAFCHSRRY